MVKEKMTTDMGRKYLLLIMLFIAPVLLVSGQSGAFGTVKGNAMELYNTGRNLESQGRMQEAESYYGQAVKICTDDISSENAGRDTYAALTWTLLRQQKYNELIAWGERSLRVYNDEYRVVETMGEAYFYLNEYENSLKFMQRYVSSLPRGDRVSVAYFFIGEIYRLEQKYHLADMAYSTAVRLQPGIALWWYRLGLVRENAGESAPAADAYEQAVKLTPDYQAAADGLKRVKPR